MYLNDSLSVSLSNSLFLLCYFCFSFHSSSRLLSPTLPSSLPFSLLLSSFVFLSVLTFFLNLSFPLSLLHFIIPPHPPLPLTFFTSLSLFFLSPSSSSSSSSSSSFPIFSSQFPLPVSCTSSPPPCPPPHPPPPHSPHPPLLFPPHSRPPSAHSLTVNPFIHPTPSLPSSHINPLLSSPLSHPPTPSPYRLSPHSFIRILPFTLLDAALGQGSSGGLQREARSGYVSTLPNISLLADLLSLIGSFQAAGSVLQGCSCLTPTPPSSSWGLLSWRCVTGKLEVKTSFRSMCVRVCVRWMCFASIVLQ